MANADAYQATAGIKQAEVSANAEKARELTDGQQPFSKAVAHLNQQTERGVHAPKLPWDPLEG